MNRYMNVYRIHLEPHEDFMFWHDGDKFTPIANLEHPCPGDIHRIWTSGGWIANPNFKPIERISVPTVGVYFDDIENYVIENAFEMSKILIKDDLFNNYSIFINQKPFDNKLVTIGLCGVKGCADTRDFKIEYDLNRKLKLSAFW